MSFNNTEHKKKKKNMNDRELNGLKKAENSAYIILHTITTL